MVAQLQPQSRPASTQARTEAPTFSEGAEAPRSALGWGVAAWGLAGILLTGAVASTVAAAPTGLEWWDPLLTGGFAAGLTALLSVAPRWILFVGLAAAAGLGHDGLWSLGALAGLGVAVGLEALRVRWWPLDVAVSALLTMGLLHIRPLGPFGSETLAVGLFVVGVTIAGFSGLGRLGRRKARRMIVGVVVLLAVSVLGAAVGGWRAEDDLSDGSEAARLGLNAARDGDVERASVLLGRAVTSLSTADRQLNAWYVQPAQLVPVLAQHLGVARAAAGSALEVADAANLALLDADVEQLRVSDGAIDVEMIEAMAGPLGNAADSLDQAVLDMSASRSPWLIPAVANRVDDVVVELGEAAPEARKAATATRLLPAMLGAVEAQRYLVLFATPAEARELGGIVGNVVELTVDQGQVTITDQKRDGDLNRAGPGVIQAAESYPARFLINRPDLFSQNWSGMTDLPSVARAVSELYPSMGGRPLDGVLYVDPFGIAALMEFTGPVEVPEIGRTLDAESVVPFLLVEQYELFDQEDRISFLDRIAVTTFERLLKVELPSPRRVGDALGPAARQGRLQMATFDDEENAFLESLFLLGDLPEPDGGDHLAVVHANGGADKLDAHLSRTVRYDADVDPATGVLSAVVSIELTNSVPDGLPDYVLGHPDRDPPPGTNRVHLSIYTPHELRQLEVDGDSVDPELQQELGYQRYLVFADVAPGQTVTVVYRLEGVVDLADGSYRLTIAPQATVVPDEVVLDVRVGAARLAANQTVVEDTEFSVPLQP